MALALAATIGVVGLRLLHHTAGGRRFDISAGRDAGTGLATSHALAVLLDTVSVASLALVGAALVGFAVVRRRPDLALACGVLLAGSLGTTELLKRRLHSPPGTPESLRASYPSGHATIALALGLALVLLTPPARRAVAALVAVAYAAAVGSALVVTAWHYPSDVGGGFCVATAWAAGAASLVQRPAELRVPLRLLATAAAAGLAAVAVLLLRPGTAVHAHLHAALAEGIVAIATIAVACIAAFTYAIAAHSPSTAP